MVLKTVTAAILGMSSHCHVSRQSQCPILKTASQKCSVKVIANEQPGEDARLLGDSIIKPCAKVPRQNESRSDVT